MTGAVEITRNASKAARGLVSIQSRLNQIVDETSSTGQKLLAFYQEHNIQIFDEQGQLMSLYDILGQVSKQWGSLTTNEKDYYLNIQAGANQTVQLSSILSNYDHVLEATATAYNSAGSAAKENTAAVDSLAGRTKQVQAAFQDLATDTIDSQLVKSVLNLTTKLLELADTGLGQILTKIGLLTGVGWGISSLVGASKVIPVVTTQFANFGTMLSLIAQKEFVLVGSLTTFSQVALPVIGVVAALGIGAYELYKKWRELNPTFEEAQEELKTVNEQLKINRDRINEINELPWYDRTAEINKEREALEKDNEELQKRKGLLSSVTSPEGEEDAATTYYHLTGKSYDRTTGVEKTYDKVFSLRSEAEEFARANGIILAQIDELNGKLPLTGEALESYVYDAITELNVALKTNGTLTAEQNEKYLNLLPAMQEVASKNQAIAERVNNLTNRYNEAAKATNEAIKQEEFLNTTFGLTHKELDDLIELFPELNNSLKTNGDNWGILRGAVETSATGMITADGRLYEADKERVTKTIALLKEMIKARLAEMKNLAASMDLIDPYSTEAKRIQADISSMLDTVHALEKAQANVGEFGWATKPSGAGGGSGATSTKTRAEQLTDEALKTFQSAYQELQHQRDMDVINEAEYYEKLEILMKEYIANAIANMKAYGLTEEQIQQNMYQYEKEIYEGRKKLSDELVNKQISAYKALFSMGSNVAQDRINELQEELKLLEEQNDELEDSIRLEQLQDKLAQARSQKVMVYKDGRFQYVSDTDEVASAQADIVAYEHEKILDAEKKRINDQIAYWQEWGSKWSSAVSDYEEQQNDLLVLEQFGITREDNLWDTRIKNLQDFVNEYSNLLNKLSTAQAEVNKQTETNLGGVTGAAAIGDKKDLQISYTGKPQGPYASAEDDPGVLKDANGNVVTIGSGLSNGYFIGTTNSGETVSIKAQATTNAGMPLSQKVPTTSRDTSLAGETVSAGGYTIKYDNDGYVTSMKRNKFAQGTTSASRGLSLVGENGPELRVLGQGDGIIPSDVTRNLWSWGSITPSNLLASLAGVFNGSNGGQMISIANLNLPGVHDGQSFVEYMRNNFWRTTVQAVTV